MKMKMTDSTKNYYQRKVFEQLEGNSILIHPGLKNILGGMNEVIWFSQILYWYDKSETPGVVRKSRRELETETGLTRDQQIRVEYKLKALGIVSIDVKPGRPSLINHISINFDRLGQLIPNLLETLTLEISQTNKITSVDNVNQSVENAENISENTHDITHNKEPPRVDGSGYLLFQEAKAKLVKKRTL